MTSFFSRVFGSASTPTAARRAPEAPKPASRPVAPTPDIAPESVPVEWTARDGSYWQDRTAHVLDRLRSDWSKEVDAAKWPDVSAVLDLLSAPPEEVMRQLPAAAREAMALCDNAALSRGDLAERLSRDPSLVQGLLRQANGAFYGAGLAPILRVDAAIDRIGIAGTRAVVLASCVDGLLSKPGAPYDAMLSSVWTHMVNVGALSRGIAPAFGADAEEAFAVALLHDVGKLVIFDRISTLRTAKRKPVVLPDAWLSLVIEQLHEPLGAVAAHRWGLGPRAADAIGSHHRRERPAVAHALAETLFLAERAEHAIRNREPLDFEGVWSLGQLSGDSMICRGILGRHLRAA